MDTNPNRTYNLIRQLIAVYMYCLYCFLPFYFSTCVYSSFTISNGTVTLSNNISISVSSDVIISVAGILSAADCQINVGRRWENSGNFICGSSTVTFYTTHISTLTGNTTFYYFSCETGGKEIEFTKSSTQTVTIKFTLTGTSGNLIKLRSTESGSKWGIRFPNFNQTANYVDVQDSDALISTVTCNYSNDAGNNNNFWVFPNNPPTISGLTQLAGTGSTVTLTSMQWTNSSVIISSFTLYDGQSADTIKYYLWASSVTTAGESDWTNPFFVTTSALLSQGALPQGTTGYHWPTLTEKTTYWWRCWAEDNKGATSSTNTTLGQGGVAKFGFDNSGPSPISNLTALTGTVYDGDVILYWTSPGDDGMTGNIGNGQYWIKSSTNNITDFGNPSPLSYQTTISTSITPLAPQSFTVTGLNPGTTYYFAIKTRDAAGNWSSWSTVGVNTANSDQSLDLNPNPPVVTAISQSSWTVNVSWEKPVPLYVDDLSEYKVYRASFSFASTTTINVIQISTITHPSNTYLDTGLTRNVTYYYRILTYDKGDQDNGLFSLILNSTLSATVDACPVSTDLNKVMVSVVYDSRGSNNTNNYGVIDGLEDADGTVTWDWPFIPDGGTITNYYIEISTDIGFSYYSSSATLSATISTYTATNLSKGYYHYARVKAKNNEMAEPGGWKISDGIYVNKKKIDGTSDEWTGTYTAVVDSITVSNGDALWRDKMDDQRKDKTNSSQLDISSFSISSDEYNLYFYFAYASTVGTGGFDGRNWVQIMIDNDSTSEERVFRGRDNKYEDSYVSGYVPWEWNIEVISGNDLARAVNNKFGDIRYGIYKENTSGYYYEVAMPLSKLGGKDKFLGKTVNFTVANFWNDVGSIGDWASLATNSNIVDVLTTSGTYTWDEVSDQSVDFYLQVTFSSTGVITDARGVKTNYIAPPDEPENISNGVSPAPPSALDYILYNIFIDAWYNGDTSNDTITDSNDYGGDFQGVIDKADYLNEMGINMGYFGPPTEFGGGIWGFNIDDAFKHETKFGGTAKYIEMVKTLHNHNIDVMIDWVCGQVGSKDSPTAKKNPTYFQTEQFGYGTKQEFAEPRAFWLNNMVWYFSICDAFRYDNPKFWNDPPGIGPEEAEFNRALRRISDRWDPQLYIMGEVPEDAGAYNDYTGNRGPMLHGAECMRSGGYKNNRNSHICSWVREGADKQTTATAGQGIRDQQVNWKNEWSINPIMMENHDECRFISRGRGDDGASWGYDSQVGYMTAITVGPSVIIFYGGEVGMEGPYDGGNPAKMDVGGNVRLMEFDRVNVSPWTNVRPAIRRTIQAMANFAPLRSDPKKGGWWWPSFTPDAGDDVMVYRRNWGSDRVLCLMNRDNVTKNVSSLSVAGDGDANSKSKTWKNWLNDDDGYSTDVNGYLNKSGNYTIDVPGHSGLILVKDGYDWVNCTGTVNVGGAIIDIDQKSHWTVTADESGYYSISGDLRKILTGSHTMRCWAPGYSISTQNVNFTTAGGVNKVVNFTLTADGSPPSAPVGLSGQPRKNASMLCWRENTEDDIQTYLIYRSETPIPDGSFPTPIFEVFKPFYYDNNLDGDYDWGSGTVINRLQNGTTYYYRIRAVDRNGNKSALSNEVTVVPRAVKVKFWLDTRDYVGGVTSANIAGGALTFSNNYWEQVALDSNGDGTFQKTFEFDDTTFLEYKYIANGSVWEGATGSLFSDGSAGTSNRGELTDDNVPDVEIIDEGNGEMILANKWRYYNDQAPRTPAGLQITAGPQQLTVGWTKNAEPDLDHYTIWRATWHINLDPQNYWALLCLRGKDEINYVDVGLVNNNTYFYKITATDRYDKTSGESSSIYDYPRAADTESPDTPTGVVAVGGGSDGLSGIKVKWNQNYEGDLAGYNLHRSTNSGFTPIATNKLNYTLISPVSTYYTDESITTGTTYYYRLVAVDSKGNASPATSQLTSRLFPITFEIDMGNVLPSNVRILGNTEPLDWDGSNKLSIVYNSSWSITLGLIAGATIQYQYAYNGLSVKEQDFTTSSKYRDWTVPNSTTTKYDDWEEYPAILANVSVQAGANRAYLYWDQNNTAEDLAGYDIFRTTVNGQTPYIKVNTTLVSYSSPYTISDLQSQLTHYFSIKAVDGGYKQLSSTAATIVSCFISSPVYVNFGIPYNIGESSSPWGDSSKMKLYLCVRSSTMSAVWSGNADMTNGKQEMTADVTSGTYRTTVPLLRGNRYNFIFFAETTDNSPNGLKANTEYYDTVPGFYGDYDVVTSSMKFVVSTSSTSVAGSQYGWFGKAGINNDARRMIFVPPTLSAGATWFVFANFGSSPTAPTYINAIPGNQKITLQWSSPYGQPWTSIINNVPTSGGESMKAADVVCGGVYHIYYCISPNDPYIFANYTQTATVSGQTFSKTFYGLDNAKTYYYLMRSSDAFKGNPTFGTQNHYSTLSSTVSAQPTSSSVIVKIRVNSTAKSPWPNLKKTIAFQEGQTVSAWDETGRSNLTPTGLAVEMTAPTGEPNEREFSINLTPGTTHNFLLFAYSTFTITGLQTGTTYNDTVPYSGESGMFTSTSTTSNTDHGKAWFGSVGATGDSRRLLYVPWDLGGGATLYVYCNFSAAPTNPSVSATCISGSSLSIRLDWVPYGNWGTGDEKYKAVDVIAGGFYHIYRSTVSTAGPYLLWASTNAMTWTDNDRNAIGDDLGLVATLAHYYVIVSSDAYCGTSSKGQLPNLYRTGAPEFSSADASFAPAQPFPAIFKVENIDHHKTDNSQFVWLTAYDAQERRLYEIPGTAVSVHFEN